MEMFRNGVLYIQQNIQLSITEKLTAYLPEPAFTKQGTGSKILLLEVSEGTRTPECDVSVKALGGGGCYLWVYVGHCVVHPIF